MPYSSSQISSEQKAQLHEVADGMLKIYETLVEMRYIESQGIVRGPHDISDLLETYEKHNLDPSIIYLYSILPYLDAIETEARDFFHGGAFVDFRKPRDVERGRDPYYASPSPGFDAENGEYMRPWATPLSNLGNHGTVLLYDARQHRIWAIDQCGWSSTDPGVQHKNMLKGTPYEAESSAGSDWGGDEEEDEDYNAHEDAESGSEVGSDGSSEFWDDEAPVGDELDQLQEESQEGIDFDEGFDIIDDNEKQEADAFANHSDNRNSFAHIKSRPAPDVLRDINAWYRALKEVPGQGEYSGWLEPKILRPLYTKNGWPDSFDGDAFEIDYARAYCIQRARYHAEQPLRQVECYESWLEYSQRDVDSSKESISAAENVDAEWLARFELWEAEERHNRTLKDLADAKAKAERMCPGGKCQQDEDLPLWEMERLRIETLWKREQLNRAVIAPPDQSDPTRQKAEEARRRRQEKVALVYSKAYAAAKAEAERLCPGRTFTEATGQRSQGRQTITERIEKQKHFIKESNAGIEQLKAWATKVPSDALSARKRVEEEIEKRSTESMTREIKRLEKWRAEHGDGGDEGEV